MSQVEYIERRSVVLRYAHRNAMVVDPTIFERTTLREGAAIVDGGVYRGVVLKYLDLSSLSSSGTFKDWVASFTLAHCLQHGISQFITQSSGNTGNALACYASHCGVRVIVLYPRSSRYKIDAALAVQPGVTFVELGQPEQVLKDWARAFSLRYGLPWLPELDLQIQGNKLRAYFVADWLTATQQSCDWHVQALSSAYGPLGFYEAWREMPTIQDDERLAMPRFLGVQQESVAPFAREISGYEPSGISEMIEPTLFRTEPTPNLLEGMRRICTESHGRVAVVANRDYLASEDELLARLRVSGLDPVAAGGTARPRRILERAGLIATLGALRAIDDGTIGVGQTVLVAITGGLVPRRGPAFRPQWRVSKDQSLDALWDIGDELLGEPFQTLARDG
jgi:threonine synthase